MADSWDDELGRNIAGEDAEASLPLPAFAQDPLGVLRRRWIWMLLCLVVCLAVVGGMVTKLEPTYAAETTILVSSQAIPEEFVRSTVVEDSLGQINAIVGQVVSRQNLATLIEKYDLYSGRRSEQPLVGIIDAMRSRIEISPQESRVRIRGSSSSQIFVISFEYPVAVVAADVANELAGFFTAANITMRNRKAKLTTDFLRRELGRAEKELRNHDRKITEFVQEHRGGLPGELGANLAKLERLQAQRHSLASQIDAAEERVMLLGQQPASSEGGPTPRSLLSDLRARLEEQLVILTEEHPNVIALQRRIERLEADVAEEDVEAATVVTPTSLAIAAEKRQLRALRNQQAAVEVTIAKLDERVEATPMRQEEFSALEQRETVLRENYLAFLRKVQEAELAQSLESAQHGARISVLDRASPPSSPKRSRSKLVAAGVVASIALSFLLAILLELLDAVVVSPSHLESLSGRPILGSVPRVA
jgi:uncharacterized protein involved in exopolysaccharide biosynthesis